MARAAWIEQRQAELLECEYFHVVFTLPEAIASIARQNKTVVYNLLFTATAAYNRYEARYRQEAIVLPTQISVRAGHTPGATELFVLHAGTKVGVQTRQGDHLRISFGRDKIGWVAAAELGII